MSSASELAVIGILQAANEAFVLAKLNGRKIDFIRASVQAEPYWLAFCLLAQTEAIEGTNAVERYVIQLAKAVEVPI